MQPASFVEFAHKWSASKRTERAAAQEHFIDLCRLLAEPTPTEADKTGENYAFEKSVTKTGGSAGFADVWRRGHFAWEYKGKHRDLSAAYEQLLRYREGLDNPPLLVVCDLERFEVHTNFTDTAKRVHRFSLADLANASPLPGGSLLAIEVLQALFKAPDRLRPQETVNMPRNGQLANLVGSPRACARVERTLVPLRGSSSGFFSVCSLKMLAFCRAICFLA